MWWFRFKTQFKWHEYYTKKVKVVTFQPQKVIFHEIQRNNNGWSLCQLSVNLTTNVSCQLNFWVFVSCQLFFWPFVSCQLTPTRPSISKRFKNPLPEKTQISFISFRKHRDEERENNLLTLIIIIFFWWFFFLIKYKGLQYLDYLQCGTYILQYNTITYETNNTYRLTHSASESSGFTCTSPPTMNEKPQYRTRPPRAVLKNFELTVSERVQVNPDNDYVTTVVQ